ncbi:MAG TPA: SIR2 family protein, partial [Terriglobia bacterium]|nr:SIR2 family protein [Terriglobia bacterium]
GPKTGVIGGRRAIWAPSEPPSFMDGVFELKEVGGAGGGAANAKSSLMKIGDFACFCHFLESMSS